MAFSVLVATELGVRLFGIAPPIIPPNFYTSDDPFLPWKSPPNSKLYGGFGPGEYSFLHTHNSIGFRDQERVSPKPASTFRILAVGDSFTYGAGTDDQGTYPAILERLLQENVSDSPKKYEVINAGVSRFFSEPELLLLKGYGPRFEPDIVLIGFTPNDVGDLYIGMDAVRIGPDGIMTTKEAAMLGSVGKELFYTSHAFRAFWQVLVTQRLARSAGVRFSEIFQANGFHEKEWVRLEEDYAAIIQQARKLGAEPIILYIPCKESWKPDGRYALQRIQSLGEKLNVYVIDGLTPLQRRGTIDQLYWRIDGHLNPQGYEQLARIVFENMIHEIERYAPRD